jgi:hypothetical protein
VLIVTVCVAVLVCRAVLVIVELAIVVAPLTVVVVAADSEEEPIRPHTARIEIDIASSRSRLKATPNLVNR